VTLIVLNFKTYRESTGAQAVRLARICEDVGRDYAVQMIVVPQVADISAVASAVKIPVYSQHVDGVGFGGFTGHVTAACLAGAGAKGSLINHSERRLELAEIEASISACRQAGLVFIGPSPEAIIAMGHQLGMVVVANGVESPAQLGFLRRNDCDLFQGYLFGEPMSAETAGTALRRRYLRPESFTATHPDRTLLLLDDEENVLRSLVRLFRRDGYRILAAGNVRDAFDLLATNDVQVILSDQRMSDMSGTEFLGRVKMLYPDTVRLVLSGYTDLATVTDAINRGAIYRILTKPWDDDELRKHIQQAFRTHDEQRGIFRRSRATRRHTGLALDQRRHTHGLPGCFAPRAKARPQPSKLRCTGLHPLRKCRAGQSSQTWPGSSGFLVVGWRVGMTMRKHAPWPSTLVTSIRPWCLLMMP